MDLFQLTRALIDIDSGTGRERAIGDFLFLYLSEPNRWASRTASAPSPPATRPT
jgi:hypothetical protein